jgi:hypothetical protein
LAVLTLMLGGAHAANIYWKPSSGNDSNNGQSASKAVKTFDRAKALVTSSSDWIILCEVCNVNANTSLDGSKGSYNVRIKRYGLNTPGNFFSIANGKSLQLKNISLYGGISGSVFNDTPPESNGNALIFVNKGGTFVMESGTELRDNWTTFGPAIKAYDGSTVHIKGGLITNCGTAHSGGAIYINAYTTTPATFIMEGGQITNCLAGTAGGAISFNNHDNTGLQTPFDITISGGEISNCMVRDTSQYGGGAIYIESKIAQASTIEINGGTIKQCSARYGGAIDARGNVSININDGLIQSCEATSTGHGGGIYMNGNEGQVHLTMDGGLFRGCTGRYGGGIFMMNNDTLVMNGGLIDSCTVTSSGGGIYLANRASCTLNGGEIAYCTSSSAGGGVHITGDTLTTAGRATVLVQNGSNVHHCTSISGPGGGLDLRYANIAIQDNTTQLHHNHCHSYGGAVNLWFCTLTLTDGEVYGNTSGDVGSADFGPGGAAFHVRSSSYIMTGGKVHDNSALYSGGAIHASHGSAYEMRIMGGEFYNNMANSQGGAINLNTNTNLEILKGSTVKFYNNMASRGGAIMLDGATLTIRDGLYYNNVATDTLDLTEVVTPLAQLHKGKGGAFCVVMENNQYGHLVPANFYIYGGEVYNNTAAIDGGGLALIKNSDFPALENPKVTIKGGNIHHNITQQGNGGGMFSDDGTIFKMTADTIMEGSVISEITTGHIHHNTAAQSGGGIYTINALFTMSAGLFEYNSADSLGGGFCVAGDDGEVYVEGGRIENNTASSMGGGFAVVGGNVAISEANSSYPTFISNNTAPQGGGLYVSDGSVTVSDATINDNVSTAGNGGAFLIENGSLTVSGSEITRNISSNGDGGGAYVGNGDVEFNNGTTVTYNQAKDGGGIYVGGGNIIYDNAIMSDNTASNYGGGMYVAGDISLQGGVIKHNQASTRGGGVYITGGGDLTMEGGTIGGTTSEGNYTVSSNSYGGGVYMNAGSATLTGGRISGNHTDNNGLGGGIFMGGGTCTLSSGATIGGTSASYANSAKHGGGIYSAGGTITVKGGKMQHNTASGDGGAIYSNGDKAKVYVKQDDTKTGMPSYIEYNTAKNGAGIYALKGLVEFSDGHIQFNKATETGGGIYVGQMDTLYLKGNANLYRNHVPTGKKGGGVYLLGVITVGEQVSNPADLGTITAKENFAYTTDTPDTYVITDETRNNVYLPEPVVNHEHHRDVITVIYNGISTASEVGFSVPSNYVPVIYCANNHEACTETGYEDYTTSQYFLHQFSTGMSLENNLFDDTHHYVAVHYVNQPLVFDPDHVYLYGFWTNIVTTDPTDGHYEEHLDDIDTPEKLAYFISYVNGINDCIGHPHPGAVGNITADIDMSQYGWVPIGELTDGFQGTLNGNGHTITGVSGLLNGEHMAYGIIGQLNGGTVKDLFVKDAVFALEYKDNLIVGGLVGDATNGGTVENSEISCTLIAMHPNTIMGGLIGRMGHGDTPAPTVHSTIAIAEMTGCEMGGLVGHLEKGNLYNSFCNTKFNLLETTEDISDKYIGGLVAVNRGTVENCYARLRGTVPTHNFGILVGDNTSGTLNFCYAPSGMNNYKKVGNNPVGSGNYAASQLPYLYRHRDTQVEATNDYVPTGSNADKQMMVVLNKWVETKNGATGVHPTYTKWGRPWQASDALKPINDDYPVLRMPLANAVASSLDNPYLAYNDIDVLLNNYKAANEAIWMYANDTLVQGENGGDDVSAKLYIDQDVALINANPLKAYVSITLDNSAGAQGMYPTYFEGVPDTTDWHMVSTPLCNAPIGINYTDGTAYEFDYGHPSGMPYYLFYPKERKAATTTSGTSIRTTNRNTTGSTSSATARATTTWRRKTT